ncbi:bzip transcription factor [Ophiostoma piceae UAMH 11346]|uniref:Bzip transcription factor n=1 Tax=Ophiostoma piceae (strain UAMH 11346) TaxID=1262450 RepID=S3CVV7_OPHP1|nr:bzip transcription factor [Ophiostoma piceae UAMH 11346]
MTPANTAHAHGSMQYPPSPPSDRNQAGNNGAMYYNMGMPGPSGMSVANTMPQNDNMAFGSNVPRDVHGKTSFSMGSMGHSRQMSTGQKSESSPGYYFSSLPQGYPQGSGNRVSMSSVESGQSGMTESSPGADMVTTPITVDGSPYSSHVALPTQMPGENYTMESILSMFPGTSNVLKSAEIKKEQEARKQAGAGKPKRVRKRRNNSGSDEVDDRRRVQNRLSQRSYRERKENTIKTLTIDLKVACTKLAEALTKVHYTEAALQAQITEHEETKRQLTACQAMLSGTSHMQPQTVAQNVDATMATSMPSMPAMPAMSAMPAMPVMPTSPDHTMDATFGIMQMGSGSSTAMSTVNSTGTLPGSGQLNHQMLNLSDIGHAALGSFPHGSTPFMASPTVDPQDANSSMESFFAAFGTD